jgi:xylan 1,4-beta-xylosidase
MRLIATIVTATLAVAAQAAPPTPFQVDVTVELDCPVGALPPIWRFFGADEPNYATTNDGAKLLGELGRLAPGRVFFRAHNLLTSGDGTPDFKWGSTNIYTEKDGKPVYDFTIVDRIIDTYVARGIHPYLQLGFMPEALTSAPRDVPYRRPWKPGVAYKGITAGWSYPPRDYAKWEELAFQWTRHNVARYGREEVERWYFQTWNEPNLDFYWVGTPEQFYRTHDYAVAGIRRALPTARVGGPDVAGAGGAVMDGFLRHVVSGTNFATGRTGTPTDFLSFHAKGNPSLVDGHVRMGLADQLRTVDEGFAKIAAVPTLRHTPIVIGENDPEGCAACPGPQNAYRNGTMYSSYTAASYARLWELARKHDVRLDGALTWAFTFVGQPWFAGYRQLATNGVDLAVLNVFRLFEKLGSEQLATVSSGQRSLNSLLANGVCETPDVGAIATRSHDGKIAILLWHYHDDDVAGPSATVRIRLNGQGQSKGSRAAALWRVDRDHANAFAAWQGMGAPSAPSPNQIRQLEASSQLKAETLAVSADGHLEISLPRQGVALLAF